MKNNFAFEINNTRQFFEKLEREYNRLIKEPLVTDHAINFAITAHHMYWDWLRKEDNTSFNKLRKKYEQMTEFLIMKDICEGSKHFERKEGKNPLVDSSYLDNGAFDYTFDMTFDRAGLIMMLNDGIEVEFIDVARNTLEFWRDYFAGRFKETDF
jgi:hypothetical protein